MNRHLIGTGLVIALFAMSAFTVAADDHRRGPERFRATLTGFEETPSTISTGARGTFKAELVTDAMGMAIEYELSYEGIEGGAPAGVTPVAFAAHIHLGARATSGGV